MCKIERVRGKQSLKGRKKAHCFLVQLKWKKGKQM